MALFQGEDMVDVTTPDGRTLTLPRSLAAMQGQPQIGAPVPFTDEIAGAPPQNVAPPAAPPPASGTIPSMTGGMMEPYSQDNPYAGGPPVQNGADYKLGTVDVKQIAQHQAKQAKQAALAMKQQAAYAATPQGQLAGVQAQQQSAADAERKAIGDASTIQAAEDDVLHEATVTRNQQIEALQLKKEADLQAVEAEKERKYGEITSLKTKIANFKTDRTADHPIVAALAIALAGFGSALKGESGNPALEAFDKAIERKVSAQMADLDQMGKVYGMTKDELDMIKEKGKSKLELWNTMIAGENEKAIRSVEEIVSRSASAKTKANAQLTLAHLQANIADKTQAAVQWGLDFDQKDRHNKAQVGATNYATSVTDRHYKAEEKIQRDKNDADLLQALAADRASGNAAKAGKRSAAAVEVQKYGIKGADGKLLLTPEGRDAMAQAAQLEAEAQQTEDKYKNDPMGSSIKSERVALLRQKAAELRSDAQTSGAVLLRNDTVASAVPSQVEAAQNMINVIDNIKVLSAEIPRSLIGKNKKQQELDALYKLLAVKGKAAWQLGAWDKGTAILSKDIYGPNPSEWTSSTMRGYVSDLLGDDPAGFNDRLEAVARDLEDDARGKVVAHATNWDGKGEVISRRRVPDMNTPVDKAAADLAQARSGLEIENKAPAFDAEGEAAAAKFGGPASAAYKATRAAAAAAADAPQSVQYPGLSKDQEAPFNTLLAAYKRQDKDSVRAGDELVAKVIIEARDRPDQAIPLLHNLKEHAGSLYTAAVAGLPKDSPVAAQMIYEANSEIARAPIPTRELATMVINTLGRDGRVTNAHDYTEIGVRAGKGDPEAIRAIQDIANANYKIKSDAALTRRGSVFGGGR